MKKLILFFVAALVLAFSSCKTTKVPAKTPTDTIYVIQNNVEYLTRIDSIYVDHYVDRYVKGDTVFVTDTKIEYKYKLFTDTVNSTDTIYKVKVEYVDKIVEKKVYPLLPYSITFIILLIAAGVIYYFYKIKK